MATIKSFSDIEVWQKARDSKHIFDLTTRGTFARDFGLRDQINRATGSIMDNIAEGFDRGSKNEFVNFLSYAKGSTGETLSQVYRALDRNHITKEEFESLKVWIDDIGRMISGFISYLNTTQIRGPKFKDRL